MSDKHENLPPPPSYEQATKGQPSVDLGNKNAPYPQQQFVPFPQVPQQPYPGCPLQYPLSATGNPVPGQCWIQGPYTGVQGSTYGQNYPMSTPGYVYSSVPPSGTVTYTGATFVVTPGQAMVNKRKQMILCFMVGVIMLVIFIIIISSIMG